MNYYPWHIGDYMAHTGHLSVVEDCAYRRLLDVYYLAEKPLPLGAVACARLVRMRQHEQEVLAVLEEFFERVPDGWAHRRCDAEIARFQDKCEKARASAEASVKARRAKAERTLNERSARTLNERSTPAEPKNSQPTGKGTDRTERTFNERSADVQLSKNQEPRTKNQKENHGKEAHANNSPPAPDAATAGPPDGGSALKSEEAPEAPPSDSDGSKPHTQRPIEENGVEAVLIDSGGIPDPGGATKSGAICFRLRRAGIADTNPQHPRLLALIAAGATVEEFVSASTRAKGKGNPFAYLLSVVESERRQAAAMASHIHHGAMPNKQEAMEAKNRAIAAQWAEKMRARNEAV